MKLTATRKFEFSYAHRLPEYQGVCADLHGHNAILEVTVTGQDPTYPDDMVMDPSALKHLVNKYVIRHLDHKYLNDIVGLENPTTENIAQKIWNQIEAKLPASVILDKIRLGETERSWVTLER